MRNAGSLMGVYVPIAGSDHSFAHYHPSPAPESLDYHLGGLDFHSWWSPRTTFLTGLGQPLRIDRTPSRGPHHLAQRNLGSAFIY